MVTLENGVPSKDINKCVISIVNSQILQHIQILLGVIICQVTDKNIRPKQTILAIDGKTMCGNKSANQKPLHIVSAYGKEESIYCGQVVVQEKTMKLLLFGNY